jgi:hypothetical protein
MIEERERNGKIDKLCVREREIVREREREKGRERRR